MTRPRSVADVLGDHLTLEVECIDRMYLNLCQPRLQHELGVVGFFKLHRGFPFVSSALMDPISKEFVADQGADPPRAASVAAQPTGSERWDSQVANISA